MMRDPIRVAFGQKLTLQREATVTRAGPISRAFTKLAAHFELTELYDGLARDQVEAVLDFAARSLDMPALAK